MFVDPQSYPVIAGTEIDFVDSLQGSGFKINNPNAMACAAAANRSLRDKTMPYEPRASRARGFFYGERGVSS